MERWSEVRRLVLTGELSKRQAREKYELHWDTLKKILQHEEPPGYRRKQPLLGPFVPLIHEILEADKHAPPKQRHTAKRILERLREKGYRGSRTVVQEEIRRWKRRSAEVFMPLAHRAGEAQVDFGEATVLCGMSNGLRRTVFAVGLAKAIQACAAIWARLAKPDAKFYLDPQKPCCRPRLNERMATRIRVEMPRHSTQNDGMGIPQAAWNRSNNMLKLATSWCAVVLFVASTARGAETPLPGENTSPAIYVRKESLQETLLATRQRFRAWLREQPAAGKAVTFTSWLATPPMPPDRRETPIAADSARRFAGQTARWPTRCGPQNRN